MNLHELQQAEVRDDRLCFVPLDGRERQIVLQALRAQLFHTPMTESDKADRYRIIVRMMTVPSGMP